MSSSNLFASTNIGLTVDDLRKLVECEMAEFPLFQLPEVEGNYDIGNQRYFFQDLVSEDSYQLATFKGKYFTLAETLPVYPSRLYSAMSTHSELYKLAADLAKTTQRTVLQNLQTIHFVQSVEAVTDKFVIVETDTVLPNNQTIAIYVPQKERARVTHFFGITEILSNPAAGTSNPTILAKITFLPEISTAEDYNWDAAEVIVFTERLNSLESFVAPPSDVSEELASAFEMPTFFIEKEELVKDAIQRVISELDETWGSEDRFVFLPVPLYAGISNGSDKNFYLDKLPSGNSVCYFRLPSALLSCVYIFAYSDLQLVFPFKSPYFVTSSYVPGENILNMVITYDFNIVCTAPYRQGVLKCG